MSFHQVPMDDFTKLLIFVVIFMLTLYWVGLFIFVL